MNTHRGFSTLEILIAMTVLVLCFSATILLLPGIQDASVDTELGNESLGIAKEMLEREQALSRKDFKLVVPSTSTETIGNIVYTKVIEVEQYGDLERDRYVTKKVTARVSWGGMFSKSQKTELSTIVSNFQQIVGGDTCYSVLTSSWTSPSVTNRLLGANILGDSTTNYPISDLDAYYGRLYVAVRGTNASQGPRSPGTLSNSTTAGTLAWNTPANAASSNNSFATRAMSGNQATNYLRASNLGFDIPDGATILGIQVSIERSRSSGSGTSNNIRDNEVKIVRANGTVGATNRAVSTSWSTTDTTQPYGSASDLWGEEWTARDINDSDFGVVLSAVGVPVTGGNNRTAQVDHITVAVTYVPQFYTLSLATPTAPTRVGELKTATGVTPISSGLNAITVATSTSYGDYAFAAANSSTRHLQVIDIAGTDPTLIASYEITAASGVIANTIAYKDGYVYMGTENNTGGAEFFVIDVHNPAVIPAPLSSYEVGSGINEIRIKDGYAYLATNDASRELVVLDLGDLAHPSLHGVYNAPGAAPGQGKSLYTVGDTLYLGRYYSSSGNELIILNAATANPTVLGGSDIGTSGSTMGVYGALVRDTLAFLLTGNTTNNNDGRIRIMNVTNPASPTNVASLSLPNSGAPSALDCEADTLYAASVPTSGGQTNKGSITIIRP